MDNICAGCLCSERKLVFLYDTGYFNLYSQIINEISAYVLDFQTIKICWECKALLKKVDVFKEQVKGSHAVLLNCVQQNDTSKLQTKPSHLHIHSQYNIDIVEVKIENDVFDDDKLAVSPVETSVKLEYPNTEHHLEPESFVKDLHLQPVKNKKELKKKITKPIKEKIKSKLKVKEKPVKKKIKAKKKISKTTKKVNDDVINDDRDDDDDVNHFCDDDDDQKIHLEETEVKDVITQSDVKELDVPTINGVISNGDPSTELPERPRCVECGKNFSSKKTYRYHLNVLHKGQNRYPCPRCGKVYQWKSNLGRHMRSHKARDSGELYCETCDKRFASVATYRQHLRVSRRHVSESEFSFMCNECGKKFVNKTRLRDHIDWEHLKKIKFKCQLCNKPFKCHTSLYVHMQNVHRNKEKKTNLCHVCGKSYQNAAKLKYHIVAMHTSETPYQCSQCNAAFGWYSSLYRHVREVHYKMKLHQKKSKKGKKIDVSSIMGQPVILPQIHQPGPP